ncbi:MAG TPA: hypothetical protein VL068_11860, partial [Microthrixaceae bacterium]|nr:hypothetical protein [Microthrixaceae bacterium]
MELNPALGSVPNLEHAPRAHSLALALALALSPQPALALALSAQSWRELCHGQSGSDIKGHRDGGVVRPAPLM